MAEVRQVTSVQAKKSSNSISWVAPVVCVLVGYAIWRGFLGNASNFTTAGEGWFWPDREGPLSSLYRMYQGGIIVPILIGALLTVVTFVIERFLTIAKASGTGNNAE